jgi:hypothetical protein
MRLYLEEDAEDTTVLAPHVLYARLELNPSEVEVVRKQKLREVSFAPLKWSVNDHEKGLALYQLVNGLKERTANAGDTGVWANQITSGCAELAEELKRFNSDGVGELVVVTGSGDGSEAERSISWMRQTAQGGTLWDKRVYPEPEFLEFSKTKDDGSVKLARKQRRDPIYGWLQKVMPTIFGAGDESESEAVAPKPRELGRGKVRYIRPEAYFTEFHVLVPETLIVSKEVMKQLLGSIGSGQFPVTLEFLGIDGRVEINLIVEREDKESVLRQIGVQFPEVTLVERKKGLHELYADLEDKVPTGEVFDENFLDMGAKGFVASPIKVINNFTVDPLTALIGAISNTSGLDLAVVQFTFHRAQHPWGRGLMEAFATEDGNPKFSCTATIRIPY